MMNQDTSIGGERKGFPDTTRKFIAKVQNTSASERRAGFEALSVRYWKPIYYHVRIGWAKSNEDAKDLTQGFLVWLMEGEALRRFSSARASFRTYLKSLLKHFVQHVDRWAGRQKRGGDVRILPLSDEVEFQGSPPAAPPGTDKADRAFGREWVAEILARAVGQVRERYLMDPHLIRFRVFEEYDLGPPDKRPTYAELAARHGLKESDVRNYLFLVREEVRQAARSEMASLSEDPGDLEWEENAFFGC
ncbi:MAG TPA: hypothetical protein VMU54_25915 [Planctomycetota bacterium]|nr:hypothetical protein [Planctomycetota bacterium]